MIGFLVAGGKMAMADTVIYRTALAKNRNRTISVKKKRDGLYLVVTGFSGKTLELKATGGGVSACRTIIEHDSTEANVILSLAIPSPAARCRMLPSFVSIESRNAKISVDEASVKRLNGNDTAFRDAVEKALGTMDEGGI
jgi:hypothetical protein